MNFTQSIEDGFSQYAEFDGRSGRAEYWYWLLFVAVVAGTLAVADALFASTPYLTLLSIVPLGVPTAAVQARRMHDLGRSGWFALAALAPPLTILVLAASAMPGEARRNRHGF